MIFFNHINKHVQNKDWDKRCLVINKESERASLYAV